MHYSPFIIPNKLMQLSDEIYYCDYITYSFPFNIYFRTMSFECNFTNSYRFNKFSYMLFC